MNTQLSEFDKSKPNLVQIGLDSIQTRFSPFPILVV